MQDEEPSDALSRMLERARSSFREALDAEAAKGLHLFSELCRADLAQSFEDSGAVRRIEAYCAVVLRMDGPTLGQVLPQEREDQRRKEKQRKLLKTGRAAEALRAALANGDTWHDLFGIGLSLVHRPVHGMPRFERDGVPSILRELEALKERCAVAASALRGSPGRRPTHRRLWAFILPLATILIREGVPMSSAEGAVMVRLCERICGELKLDGDVRSALRAAERKYLRFQKGGDIHTKNSPG